MIGVLPLAVTAPAAPLSAYRWWYIAPGRLFGLLLDENGRPLEVAFGSMAPTPATQADQPESSRPAWCPTGQDGTQGYIMTYAPFPLSVDQLSALVPEQPWEAAGGYDIPTNDQSTGRETQQTSESPALREEVDLSVQLKFPVCSFLDEARGDLRLHSDFTAQGHMILTRFENRVGVTTTVQNLLPLQDPLPPGLYFYEAWLEQVDEDGVVRAAVPAGVVSVGSDGTGTGFRELDAENVDGTGLPIEAFNGTSITAQPRDGVPGQSEYVILEGTLPRTVKW